MNKLELLEKIDTLQRTYLFQTDVKYMYGTRDPQQYNDGAWSPMFYKVEFDNLGPKAPIFCDCDNRHKIHPDVYYQRVQQLIQYLESLNMTCYMWKTSGHKPFPGYHIVTDEVYTWNEICTYMESISIQFSDILDQNSAKSIQGETMEFSSKNSLRLPFKRVAIRVSPRIMPDNSKPIKQDKFLVYGSITNSSSTHIQLIELYRLKYAIEFNLNPYET